MNFSRLLIAGLCAGSLGVSATEAELLPTGQALFAAPPPQSPWQLCAPPPTWVQQPEPGTLDTTARRQAPVEVSAAGLDGTLEQQLDLNEAVTLERADQHLAAEHLRYEQPTQQVTAEGEVYYRAADLELRGERMQLNLETDQGEVTAAEYWLPRRHGRGTAARVVLEDAEHSYYQRLRYTTCSPEAESWRIDARELRLDEATQTGVARDMTLRLFGAPVLYLPYFSFPLSEQRKSGFLLPGVASSDRTGFDFSLPYYWNIAPNLDATLTPRVMSERGLQLGLEARYLLPAQRGALALDYLPQDTELDEARGSLSLRQAGLWAPWLSSDISADFTSDSDYYRDFGNTPSLISSQHLERRADVNLHRGAWSLLGRVQAFQTLDEDIIPANRPYQRLPQVVGRYQQPHLAGGLDVAVQTEYVYFDHGDNLTGSRVDLLPSVSWSGGQRSWGYLTPKLSYRYTAYDLDERSGHPLSSQSPQREVPTFSLDSGLWFERPSRWLGTAAVQTLEPRLFYLYVPQRDQDALPNFDSAPLDFSFSQLFRENRFSGTDRLGDANQLTLALTSRWLAHDSGTELARISAGRILYFSDREVALVGQTLDEQDTSAWVTELNTRWGDAWSARATLQWNSETQTTEQSVLQLHYQPDQRHILNLAYRLREADLEQTDVSVSWQLSPRWQMIGRWNYALDENRSLETLGGFEYESCCWVVRAFASRYVTDGTDAANHALAVQLELKGLTSLGQQFSKRLQQRILGYGVDDYAF